MSPECLLTDLIIRSDMLTDLLSQFSIPVIDKVLSDCSLLYFSKRHGPALFALVENVPRICNPANLVTPFKAT